MGQDGEDGPGRGALVSKEHGEWDHELELGNDLRVERRLVWKEILVVLLVLTVVAVRLLLF